MTCRFGFVFKRLFTSGLNIASARLRNYVRAISMFFSLKLKVYNLISPKIFAVQSISSHSSGHLTWSRIGLQYRKEELRIIWKLEVGASLIGNSVRLRVPYLNVFEGRCNGLRTNTTARGGVLGLGVAT